MFLKKVLFRHVIPFVLAVATVFIAQNYIVKSYSFSSIGEIKSYTQPLDSTGSHRWVINYSDSVWAEMRIAQSLSDSNELTVFGSSELSSSEGVCYNFLTDSLGAKTLGIGHANNELFAIYCQLLNMTDYIEGAKISVILSPGWFSDGKGTSPASFVEFCPPHFISNITNNINIKEEYLNYLATTYIRDFDGKVTGNRLEYNYLMKPKIVLHSKKIAKVLAVRYKYELDIKATESNRNLFLPKWDLWLSQTKKEAVKTLNEFYIDSSYYSTYLLDENGNQKVNRLDDAIVDENIELEDLEMVMKFLKEKKCEVSFVMQSYNPYYYSNTEGYIDLLSAIEGLMKKYDYPYYNLYSKDKESYEPGTLIDIMHFSNYGWVKVNKFLYEQHFNS